MEDLLVQSTGLTPPQRKKVLSWVASLSEEEIIEIFQDGVKKSYQIKNERPGLPGKICKYCAFIVAARNFGWDTKTGKGFRVAEAKQYGDFSHLRQAQAAALIQRGRVPILRRKILGYWGEIKELKAQGHGFRVISSYLNKNRKVKASTSYLARIWKEVEDGNI